MSETYQPILGAEYLVDAKSDDWPADFGALKNWPYAEDVISDLLDPELIEEHGYAQISRALNLRRVIGVVGSGVSAAYGLSSWHDLVGAIHQVVKRQLKAARDQLTASTANDPKGYIERWPNSRIEKLCKNLADLGLGLDADTLALDVEVKYPVVLDLFERLFIELDAVLSPEEFNSTASKKKFRDITKRLLGDMFGLAEILVSKVDQKLSPELRSADDEANMGAPTSAKMGAHYSSPKSPPANPWTFLQFFKYVLEQRRWPNRAAVGTIATINDFPSLLAAKLLDLESWVSAIAAASEDNNVHSPNLLGMRSSDIFAEIANRVHQNDPAVDTDNIEEILRQPGFGYLTRALVVGLVEGSACETNRSAELVERAAGNLLIRLIKDVKSRGVLDEIRTLMTEYQDTALTSVQMFRQRLEPEDELLASFETDRRAFHDAISNALLDRMKDHRARLVTEKELVFDVSRQRRNVIPKHRDPLSRMLDYLLLDRFITTNFDMELERLLTTRGYKPSDGVEEASRTTGPTGTVNALGARAQEFVLGSSNASDLVDFATQGRDGRILYFHIHGRVTDDTDIVLTEQDYQDLYLKDHRGTKAITDALQLTFASNPLLFVGAGMNEEDVVRPLRVFQSNDISLTDRLSVALLPCGKEEKHRQRQSIRLMAEFGVYAIHYGRGRFASTTADEGNTSVDEKHVQESQEGQECFILQRILKRIDDLERLRERLSDALSTNAPTNQRGRVHQDWKIPTQALVDKITTNLREIVEIEGFPASTFPVSVESTLLQLSAERLEKIWEKFGTEKLKDLRAEKAELDQIALVLEGLVSGFLTPFCCAALTRMRQRWAEWRTNWGRLPNTRVPLALRHAGPFTNDLNTEKPYYVQRHPIVLRDLDVEALAGSKAALPSEEANDPELSVGLRRDPPAPRTDRFFAGAPSPSFRQLVQSLQLEETSPSASRLRPIRKTLPVVAPPWKGRRVFLLLADRGLGKGQFFAAIRSPRRFAAICEALGIAKPALKTNVAPETEAESNSSARTRTSHVHRAFFNLGLSNEVLSIFDRLILFLEKAHASMEKRAEPTQGSEQLTNNRLSRLKQALANLDEVGRRQQNTVSHRRRSRTNPRVLVAINHTNMFFESDGRAKNAQVLALFETLISSEWQHAPIDFILMMNDTLIPHHFKEKRRSELAPRSIVEPTDLSTTYTPQEISFRHIHPPQAMLDDLDRELTRFKNVGLRIASSTAQAGYGQPQPFYVHALRRTRPEVFSARFFPLAASGLVRLANVEMVRGLSDSDEVIKAKQKTNDELSYSVEDRTYRWFEDKYLTAERASEMLEDVDEFQKRLRDEFEERFGTQGPNDPSVDVIDRVILSSIAAMETLMFFAPGTWVTDSNQTPHPVPSPIPLDTYPTYFNRVVASVTFNREKSELISSNDAICEAICKVIQHDEDVLGAHNIDEIIKDTSERLKFIHGVEFPHLTRDTFSAESPGDHLKNVLGRAMEQTRARFEEIAILTGRSRFAMTIFFAAVSDIYESAIRGASPLHCRPADSQDGKLGKRRETLRTAIKRADGNVKDLYQTLRLATSGKKAEACEGIVISEVLKFFDQHYAAYPVWPINPRISRLSPDRSSTLPDEFEKSSIGTDVSQDLLPARNERRHYNAKPLWQTLVLERVDLLLTRHEMAEHGTNVVDRSKHYGDAFLKRDAIIGDALENAPGGILGTVTESVLVALSLIGKPVTSDVLIRTPDVKLAVRRLCATLNLDQVLGAAIDIPAHSEEKNVSQSPSYSAELPGLQEYVLLKHIDLCVHRCLVFRVKGKQVQDKEETSDERSHSRSETRFAVHKAIRRFIHQKIDAPMVDYADVDQLTLSMYPTQPNDLPRPNASAHRKIEDLIDSLIGFEKAGFSAAIARGNSAQNEEKLKVIQLERRMVRAAYGVLRSVYSVGVVSGLNILADEGDAPPRQGYLEKHRLRVRWMIKKSVELDGLIAAADASTESKDEQTSAFYAEEICWMYNECAVISLVQGKLGDAAGLFERAERVATKHIESTRRGPLHNRLSISASICDIERGAGRKARRRLQHILSFDEEHEAVKAIAHGYIGLLDHLAGNLDIAEHRYGEAIERLKRMSRNRAASIFCRHMADLYRSVPTQAAREQATTYAADAVNLAANGGHEDARYLALLTKIKLAIAHESADTRDLFSRLDAIDRYARATGVNRFLCETSMTRSSLQMKMGDLEGARREADMALEVANRHDLQLRKIKLLIQKARILKTLGQADEARPLLLRAMKLADRAQYFIARDSAENMLNGNWEGRK